MKRHFSTEITVQWSDVDLAGVVYFPHFFRYFSITETEFYRSMGLMMTELEETLNIHLPRVDAQCRYLKPAKFGDRLTVILKIEHIATKTVKYRFEVKRDDEEIAEGHLVIASVSRTDFKSVPLPDKFREMLQLYSSPNGVNE